jgi:hypothetical protein
VTTPAGWPVLGSDVSTEGAPVPIVTDSDPVRLLESQRSLPGGSLDIVYACK